MLSDTHTHVRCSASHNFALHYLMTHYTSLISYHPETLSTKAIIPSAYSALQAETEQYN